jgi:hypothetical protein
LFLQPRPPPPPPPPLLQPYPATPPAPTATTLTLVTPGGAVQLKEPADVNIACPCGNCLVKVHAKVLELEKDPFVTDITKLNVAEVAAVDGAVPVSIPVLVFKLSHVGKVPLLTL